ncbi:MAG: DegV family protein [Intestinimonas sp.]
MQREGHSLEETAAWLEENRLHVCHWFTVDDLQHLRRGGRISAATAIVGTALQVKPILRVDETGHLENVDKVRGADGHFPLWWSGLTRPGRRNWIVHGDAGHGACLEDAEFVAGQLRERHPGVEIDISLYGAHHRSPHRPRYGGPVVLGQQAVRNKTERPDHMVRALRF